MDSFLKKFKRYCFFRNGTYILYERDCVPLTTAISNEISPCIKRVSDISKLNEDLLDFDRNQICDLIDNGVDLFVYEENYRIIGMMCGYVGPCFIKGPGIMLNTTADTLYWFWILTSNEARGRRVYSQLKNYFFNYYDFIKKTIALVEYKNDIMHLEMYKIGFKKTRKLKYIRLNNLSLIIEHDCINKKNKFYINNSKNFSRYLNI